MNRTIASTYEIIEEIGSGGIGKVYLARHRNLNIRVILKAERTDKKKTSEENLRREADILKNLKNPYIPLVYDCLWEDNNVYTVMEYIEGESLDKFIGRGELPTTAQLVRWTVQLLEALSYLHNPVHGDPPKGYVHSDIKPANIMVRPNGDISLIDFNISRMIGEQGVRGFTRGYASPEHYIYSVVPDERSDIYSVGATLYHLLSGVRPNANAVAVAGLDPSRFDSQLIAIIEKAMQPDKEKRYQSADEMRQALLYLKKNAPQSRKLRAAAVVAAIVSAAVFAAGAFCTFTGLKRMQKKEEWLKLTEYSRDAYREGDVRAALQYAVDASPRKSDLFTPQIRPQTQLALTRALGVYNLGDGYQVDRVAQLPSQLLYADISPDGRYAACICLGELVILDTETGDTVRSLQTVNSALAEVRFVGQNTVLYASDKGLAAYDIAGDKVKWTGSMATGIAVSGDGKVAAGIYRDEPECILYDAHSGEVLQKIDLRGRYQPVVFNDIGYNPGDSLLVLSEDGSKLGISLDKGLVRVYDRTDETRTIDISDDDARFSHFEGGFCGDRFMFAASDSQRAEVMILDVNTQAVVYNDADFGVFRVRAGEDGFWVSRDNRVLKYNAETESMEQYFAADSLIRGFCRQADTTIVVTDEGIDTFDGNGVVLSHAESPRTAEIFAAAGDRMILGNSNTDTLQILTYADHADAVCAEYDPEDEHIETRMCADGEHMMLFTNTGFSIYRRNGNRIDRKKLPDPDRIYDQQFRRTGGASTLEVTYYDGTVDVYDAVSGDRKSSEKGEPPDSSLYETLETEHFRIESPLHGHPVIYDKASGRQIAEIDEEAYLSYADEADGSLILRFTTTDLRQYAYIMDGKGNVLGEIPWLCDLDGGKLFLDYQDGSVRQTKIYGLEELLELADARLGES